MTERRRATRRPGAGLSQLTEIYGLADGTAGKLENLLDLLLGDPLAPTAIRDEAKAIDDHLADSLVALDVDEVRGARRAVDIGSGAGLPGLALAIALPESSFVLLESVARKCTFLERAVAECGASNASVVCARAEAWAEGIARHDLVTARAVAPLEVVAEYAAPVLRVGGTLVAWRGRRDPEREQAAERAAEALGLGPPEILPVRPYDGAQHRHLYLMSKVTETPRGFPRRPGMALKRPLGSRAAPGATAV
jgi:16S rRNA (guanine527-N7)-methyltransferase